MKDYLIKKQDEIVKTAEAEGRSMDEAEKREFDLLQDILDKLSASEPEPPKRGIDSTGIDSTDGNSVPPAEGNPTPQPVGNPEPPKHDTRSGYSQTDLNTIFEMCRSFKIEPDKYIKEGLSVEQTRAAVMEELKTRNRPLAGFPDITVTGGEGDKMKRAMVDGIMIRSGIVPEKPADGAENYREFSIRRLAEECLERETGDDYRHMSADEVFSRATRSFYNPESVFPAVMDEIIKKSYIEGLKKSVASFNKWVKFGSVPNFKKTANHEYIMSLVGELEKIPENGELPAYNPKDVRMPERQVEEWGRQFTMTRKAFINDDIGLLTTMPYRFAKIAENTQNKRVYEYLLNNKKLNRDDKPLFDASRNNTLKKGSLPELDVIAKMIYMIGIQKDEAGNQLALQPDLFIVPFGIGVEVKKLLLTPTIYSAEGTIRNPYYDAGFEVVEDVFLNGFVKEGEPVPWFMGVKREIIQIDYLNGQKECNIRRMEKPGVLGFSWDVYIDFGVSVIHPQAIVRNPGVKIGFDD